MTHKFKDGSCYGFKQFYEKNYKQSYYLLIDSNNMNSNKYKQICKINLFDIINSKDEKEYLKKIFEYKNYVLYLRKYK